MTVFHPSVLNLGWWVLKMPTVHFSFSGGSWNLLTYLSIEIFLHSQRVWAGVSQDSNSKGNLIKAPKNFITLPSEDLLLIIYTMEFRSSLFYEPWPVLHACACKYFLFLLPAHIAGSSHSAEPRLKERTLVCSLAQKRSSNLLYNVIGYEQENIRCKNKTISYWSLNFHYTSKHSIHCNEWKWIILGMGKDWCIRCQLLFKWMHA